MNIFKYFLLVIFISNALAINYDFEKISQQFTHCAIIEVKNNEVKITKNIYTKNNAIFPIITLPENNLFTGKYLIFLPDTKKANLLLDAKVYLIKNEKIQIYFSKEQKPTKQESEIEKIENAEAIGEMDINVIINKLNKIK